jgi:aspartyl-tRNA(Asn)/glutamyl-tRNA(Gln) amidotransferase subunit A
VKDLVLREIADVAPSIQSGEISPVEVVSAALQQIERFDPLLHSFITVFADQAMADARAAEQEIAGGVYRSPLHGIPIAVKDALAVAGWPTTNGSGLWAGHVTDFDATVVTRLRSAGAIVVGKNNMHEWGMGGTCTGMYFGTVHNPWDLSRVPGGSSGGSAAAVSAGMAFGAVGTDGWGSIRTPASYCGVVGLKPTPGLVSRFGEVPPTSSPMHQVGPIARGVRDVAILLEAMAGHDPLDPTSGHSAVPPTYAKGLDGELGRLRVGLPRSYFFDEALSPVREAVELAARAFEELGAEIREVDLPSLRHLPLALGVQTEAHSVLLPLALDHPEGFATPEIRFRILAAEFVRETDARRARQVRTMIASEVGALLAEVDLVLTPCNSTPAFPIGAGAVDVGDGGVVDLRMPGGQSRLTTRLTLPWNIAGVPAIALPSGHGHDGVPIAIQLAAARWNEALLLRAARGLEEAAGGYIPPLLVTAGATAAQAPQAPVLEGA